MAEDLAKKEQLRYVVLLQILCFVAHCLFALVVLVSVSLWTRSVIHVTPSVTTVTVILFDITIPVHLSYVLLRLIVLLRRFGMAGL